METSRLNTDSVAKQGKTKQLFLTLLFIFIFSVTCFSFITSEMFTVGSVIVEGNKYIEQDEIYKIAGIPENLNIFRLNTTEIQLKLKKDLRIADVDVTRKFPSTIQINVTERMPIACIACEYGFVEVDKHGVVLTAYKNLKTIHIPMLTGISLSGLYVGDSVEQPDIKQTLVYLAMLNEATLNQISEINLANNQQIVAYTNNAVQVRIGSMDRVEEKAKVTEEFLQELKQTNLAIEYIDLTFASPFIKFKQ